MITIDMNYIGDLNSEIPPKNKYGIMTNGQSSYSTDKEIFSNPTFKELYQSKIKLEKNAHINFFLMENNVDINRDYCKHIEEFLKNNNQYKNNINMFFYGNRSPIDHLPFTPWILFHRMFHGVSITLDNKKIVSCVNMIIKELFDLEYKFLSYVNNDFYLNTYNDFIKTIDDEHICRYKNIEAFKIFNNYKTATKHKNIMDDLQFQESFNYMGEAVHGSRHYRKLYMGLTWAKYLFSFKSAKISHRLITIDLVSEFFAQKFISGKISLQNVSNIPDEITSLENKKELSEYYKKCENTLNLLYDNIIKILILNNETIYFC